MFVVPRQPPNRCPARPKAFVRPRGLAWRLLASLVASGPLLASMSLAAGERSLLVVDPPPPANVVYLPPPEPSSVVSDAAASGQRTAALWMLPPQELPAAPAFATPHIAGPHAAANADDFPSLLMSDASQHLSNRYASQRGQYEGPRAEPIEGPLRFSTTQRAAEMVDAAAAASAGIPQAACQMSQIYHPEDFAAVPLPDMPACPGDELLPYYGKYPVPTQRPWVELWRPFYGDGIFPPAVPVFSDVNPLQPQLTVYGDWRAGVGLHDVAGRNVRGVANQLNLEADLRLTGTERLHAFTRPTDHNGRFTRFDFSDSDDMRFDSALDMQLDAGFFEGDLGSIWGGMTGQDAPFDLPIAAGLMPMVYQNGIWMEDAAAGVAIALPWRHSRALNWANYDATFFAVLDQLTTPALAADNSAAQAFGTAWFIEAYDGYIEADYAFVHHAEASERSYHNSSLAYTRRYFEWLSNSVRVINNSGQQGASVDRTADGTLILLENLFRTDQAATVIPYTNLFYGIRRPQSVGRAAGAGGILRNTGINFDSDNLTGYPTLDPTGANAYGGAVGLNMLTADFRRQVVLEVAALEAYGDRRLRNASGEQYAVGGRFQQTLSNWTLVRFDMMYGWLEGSDDLIGTRGEWRWKF